MSFCRGKTTLSTLQPHDHELHFDVTRSGLPGIGQLTPQPQRGVFGESLEK